MKRRDFLKLASGAATTTLLARGVSAKNGKRIDAAWYARARRSTELPVGTVAYVEIGQGQVALFVHGFPLNGFQWRGALERLHPHRRCIAPDMLGTGFTLAREGKTISPATQVEMLAGLMEALKVDSVDLVANDSGAMVVQLFLTKHPRRVRTLLLTNCDVDENSPPPAFLPSIELAKRGAFVDESLVPQFKDKQLARSAKGLGAFYTYPDRLADETIEYYLRPVVETSRKKMQMNQFAASMESNPLVAIREELRGWLGPVRMVWGLKDRLFGVEWAEWLDRTLPGSRGVRRLEGANLFFPEEMPEVIAEEAVKLWEI